jgi:diguanylate cyclase (GGDEF)-like protein
MAVKVSKVMRKGSRGSPNLTVDGPATAGFLPNRDEIVAAVEVDRVQFLYGRPAVVATNVVVAALAAAGLWRIYPHELVLAWLGLLALVVLARLGLWARHRAAPATAATVRQWAWRYTVGTLVTGCLWGLLGSIAFLAPDLRYELFAVLIVAGMSAGCVINNAAYLPALFASTLPIALPLAIALAVKGGPLAIEIDAALVTFVAVLIVVGYSTNRWIGDTARLRFERDALVADQRRSAVGLQREIAVRCQHEADLQRATQALSERTKILGLLNGMVERLAESSTQDEFSEIVRGFVPQILGDVPGALFAMNNSGNQLARAADWNSPAGTLASFVPADCWALRRSQRHLVPAGAWEVRCRHVSPEYCKGHTCVPLLGHGAIVGILYLEHKAASGAVTSDTAATDENTSAIATTLGLALANYRLREQLRTMSLRDALTSLYNRRYFEEAIEMELARAAHTHSSTCVIMGDIDHFKAINDSFGHDAGDAALRAVGQALAKAVRPGDVACRYGGEEFLIVLPGTSLHEGRERAEAIRLAVQNITVSLHGQLIGPLTMSFGVTVASDPADTAEALVANADRAMYGAKQQGRNRVVLAERTGATADTPEQGAVSHNEGRAATRLVRLVA